MKPNGWRAAAAHVLAERARKYVSTKVVLARGQRSVLADPGLIEAFRGLAAHWRKDDESSVMANVLEMLYEHADATEQVRPVLTELADAVDALAAEHAMTIFLANAELKKMRIEAARARERIALLGGALVDVCHVWEAANPRARHQPEVMEARDLLRHATLDDELVARRKRG